MTKSIPHSIQVRWFTVPASKSHAQRLLLAAALSDKPTTLRRLGMSGDVEAMIGVVRCLGADISSASTGSGQSAQSAPGINGKDLTIKPGSVQTRVLNCGESGLCIRLMAPVCAALGGDFELRATGSLQKRSVVPFEDYLPQLGVTCKTTNGFVPVKISSKARAGKIVLKDYNSSQYLSGLLMALPLLEGDSVIDVEGLTSKPYVDVTLDVLKDFGIAVENNNYNEFRISGRQQYRAANPIQVEGDWSAAANFVVLAAIKGGGNIYGLNQHSLQADRTILAALERAGSKYGISGDDLKISESKILPFVFDATHCPDLFPVLTVLAAAANGKSIISGISRLANKESNRADVLKTEFGKAGLNIELSGNEMHIYGTASLKTATIHSNSDHRIAMAGVIASLLANEGMNIDGAEAVEKSFAGFWENFSTSSGK